MRAIYLFQSDFRLRDNDLLNQALLHSSSINFVAFEARNSWGQWRKQFYQESLACLDDQLKEYGHRLQIAKKSEFLQLQFTDVDTLYTQMINLPYENKEYEILSSKVNVISLETDRLLEDVDFTLPNIFTEFRKKVEDRFQANQAITVIEKNRWPAPGTIDFNAMREVESSPFHKNSAFPFRGGERCGFNRLEKFIWQDQAILNYKETRNGLVGTNYSTKFSPWLALGCISPHRIYREVDRFEAEIHKNKSTYWVKFELWWREYFRWVGDLHKEKLFILKGIKQKETAPNFDEQLFKKWCDGETGQPFVDANMNELNQTGWMSNRGRQNVASFLVKDLKLPWTWGAEYFEKLLIDYDPWSNYGNWQYVAGVGNDPRENRYFNLEKQARVYDPEQTFQKMWS
jgi:deoxyribodipyrimidine photo-lyase